MNENNKVLIYNLINEYIHGNDEIKDIKNDEISEVINDIFTDENVEKLNNSLGTTSLDDIYFGLSTFKFL